MTATMKKITFKMPAIKLPDCLRLPPKQPVFNQPLDTQRQHRFARTIYIILLSLMTSLSVAVVALKAITLSFIEENFNMGFRFDLGNSDWVVLAALPKQLHTAPAKLSIIAGVIALLVGMTHAAFVIFDWKKGKRTQSYTFKRNAMFMHFCNSILVLFALVSIYVTHRSTSHFRQGYIMRKATSSNGPSNSDDAIRYNIGRFDLETWSCELKDVEGVGMAREDYAQQCRIETAGRVIMIPFIILAFLVAVLAIQQMMKCRRDADGERMKTEDVGLEMEKFNAV